MKDGFPKSEKLDGIEEKVRELEIRLEAKNVEVENFQKRLAEMEVQTESRVEEMLRTRNQNQNQEVASLKSEMKMEIAGIQNQLQEVKAARKNQNQEVAKSLKNEMTAAVEQGLRDLPFEMVCVYQKEWKLADSVVSYERVTVEFNNSNRPGGGDGSMDISTGVFTTVTSGYYTITFSAVVDVTAGDETVMLLHHNGVEVEESWFQTYMTGDSSGLNFYQGSRTVETNQI